MSPEFINDVPQSSQDCGVHFVNDLALFDNHGTSEGAKKGWDTRGRGRMKKPERKDAPKPVPGKVDPNRAQFHAMLADKHSAASNRKLLEARSMKPGAERMQKEQEALTESKRAVAHRGSAEAYSGSDHVTHRQAAALHRTAADYSGVANKTAAKRHGIWAEQHDEGKAATAPPAPHAQHPGIALLQHGGGEGGHGHGHHSTGLIAAAGGVGAAMALSKVLSPGESEEHKKNVEAALHHH